VQALHLSAGIFAEAKSRGFNLKLLDIGGGFPAHCDDTVPAFRSLARKINAELDRLFPNPIEILAEPGRFLVASAATSLAKIIGKAVRGGKLC
jgi:ornithine decarboxylase